MTVGTLAVSNHAVRHIDEILCEGVWVAICILWTRIMPIIQEVNDTKPRASMRKYRPWKNFHPHCTSIEWQATPVTTLFMTAGFLCWACLIVAEGSK